MKACRFIPRLLTPRPSKLGGIRSRRLIVVQRMDLSAQQLGSGEIGIGPLTLLIGTMSGSPRKGPRPNIRLHERVARRMQAALRLSARWSRARKLRLSQGRKIPSVKMCDCMRLKPRTGTRILMELRPGLHPKRNRSGQRQALTRNPRVLHSQPPGTCGRVTAAILIRRGRPRRRCTLLGLCPSRSDFARSTSGNKVQSLPRRGPQNRGIQMR